MRPNLDLQNLIFELSFFKFENKKIAVKIRSKISFRLIQLFRHLIDMANVNLKSIETYICIVLSNPNQWDVSFIYIVQAIGQALIRIHPPPLSALFLFFFFFILPHM